MNGLKIMAIVLIAVGIGVLLYGKFSYTKETHDIKLGPLEMIGYGKADGQRPCLGRRGGNSGWWRAPALCEQETVAKTILGLRWPRLPHNLS